MATTSGSRVAWLQEIHHHVERLVGMVDDEILLPDRREAIAAMVADAVGIARIVGHEFEVGPVEPGKLRHLVEREDAIDLEQALVSRVERALHEALQFRRHQRFDVEPDHRPAAAALERGLEQPHQIFGLFQDLELGVADDAKRPYPLHGIAGEQLADEQAGHAFDRDQAHFAAVSGLRQAHEPLKAVRQANERIHRLAVLGARQLQGDREAEIGNERERVRRVDGERGQQREDMGEEIVFKPGALRLGDVRAVDQHDTGLGKRGTQLTPLLLLILDQHHHRLGDPHQLLGGRQPFGALAGDAGSNLRPQAGHAHHEELVDVVRRDRQEFQPLQQRMAAIGQFLEHAAIEIEPRELAIDEAVGARCEFRGGVPLGGLAQPHRPFQSEFGAGFERDGCCRATVRHGYSLLLGPHDHRPW